MKLILIRHGESARNRGYKVAGEENNLTTQGVAQSLRLAEELAQQKMDAVYCSSMPRCIQTLEEILRDRNDDMQIHMTPLLGSKMTKENYEELKHRVEIFLDDLKYDHEDGQTVVVVSHLRPIEMMTYVLTGTKRRLENGQMVEVEYTPKKDIG